MKRLIAAGILAVLVTALCIGGNYIMQHSCNNLLEMIDDCKSAENKNSAYKKAEKLEDEWVKKETLLSLFSNLRMVDDIGVAISRISAYSDNPSGPDYIAACREAEVKLTHMRENERLSVLSVF